LDIVEIQSLLTELEQVLAGAEELRYRIQCELRKTSQAQAQPQKTTPATAAYRPSPPTAAPTATARAQLDTTTLKRNGPGFYAWTKEFGYTRQASDLGKAAGFPPRMLDWSKAQIDQVVEALEQLLGGEQPPSSTPATRSGRDHAPSPRNNGIPY